jgi:hypothetical protein
LPFQGTPKKIKANIATTIREKIRTKISVSRVIVGPYGTMNDKGGRQYQE